MKENVEENEGKKEHGEKGRLNKEKSQQKSQKNIDNGNLSR
jgi:hypothetical protein